MAISGVRPVKEEGQARPWGGGAWTETRMRQRSVRIPGDPGRQHGSGKQTPRGRKSSVCGVGWGGPGQREGLHFSLGGQALF